MRGRLLLGLFVTGLVAVGVAAAGLNGNWSDHATGAQEVPMRDTQGQGQAIFHLSKDGTSLDYKLIASNIDNVFMAHIHQNVPGQNGPIVVWLYPSTAPVAGPPGGGRTDGVLAEGTITAANIAPTAPAGYTFDQLVADMNSGNAYVNIHTNDGVGLPNTGPGDFPGGEIRADITP
jgi:CHRD domain